MTWKKEHSHKEPKINILKLEIPAIREMYQQLVEEKLIKEEQNNNDVDKTWENLKQGVTDAAITILGHAATPGRNDWFYEEALMSRNQAYKAWLIRSTRAKRAEYGGKRRFADKLCRKKKRVALNKRLCKTSEEFKKMTWVWPLKRRSHLKKGLNPLYFSAKICKEILLETVQAPNKGGRSILRNY
jgi:hypothetical protein